MSASVSPSAPAPVRVSCDSFIEQVVVYPRGALVSRAVRVPESLSAGRCELLVAGLPGEVRTSSVRVHASGKRRVTATRARLVTPDIARGTTDAKAERAELLARRRFLEIFLEQHEITRRLLADGASFESLPGDRRHLRDPAAYVAHGLGMTALLDELARETDGAIQASLRELVTVRARLAALDLDEVATPSANEIDPSLEVRIELGAGEGPPGLTVEYIVPSARYWPAYTVRFTERGTRALLSFEPFVAQTSGEDWTDVRLSIATGDLVLDAALPKLPSLRFGRAQVVKPLGYRPLPTDTGRLFEGFDAAWKTVRVPPSPPHGSAGSPPPQPGSPYAQATLADFAASGHFAEEARGIEAEAFQSHALLEAKVETRATAMPMPLGGAPPGAAPMAAMPVDYDELAMPMPAPRSKGGMFSFGGSAAPMPARASSVQPQAQAEMSRKSRHAGGQRHEPSEANDAARGPLAPPDDLLDFDGLILPAPQSPDRGRLIAQTKAVGPLGLRRHAEFATLSPPPGTRDPESSGAVFDHVFHGSTTCRVPSSARPVRVAVDRRPARATPRLTAVPRETPDVFREADVDNPFDGPLLPGPIDVLLDGSLVSETTLPLVDRGAKARIGMGVEDRVKIARNARVDEKSAGLLGGQRTVDHAITVDIVSALPFTSYLELRDRLPFADEDSGVEAKLVNSSPVPSSRDIGGAGERVRGGLLWHLELAASGTAKVSFNYRLSLSAKDEIVGGNRRD